MLWPFMPTRHQRAAFFAMLGTAAPDFTVDRWHQYKTHIHVPELPSSDIPKLEQAVTTITASFEQPFPVRAVLVQGHADYDLRRSGQEREDFEMKISKRRAIAVVEYLQQSLDKKRPLLSDQGRALLDLLFWEKEGLGSHKRIFTHPTNEFEMSRNRRAEIYFARASRPLHQPQFMICPHTGLVTRGKFAQGPPSASDLWFVVGCPFQIFLSSGPRPSPCMTVQWLNTDDGFIDITSIGLCTSIEGTPQGVVQIIG